ncbi:MAG: hypothetical protein ABQ298_07665 [Puniceicoccaceae bacterium]
MKPQFGWLHTPEAGLRETRSGYGGGAMRNGKGANGGRRKFDLFGLVKLVEE